MLAEFGWASAVRGGAIAAGIGIIITMTALAVAQRRAQPVQRTRTSTLVLFLGSYYLLVVGAVAEIVTRYGSTALTWRTPLIFVGLISGLAALAVAAFDGTPKDDPPRKPRSGNGPPVSALVAILVLILVGLNNQRSFGDVTPNSEIRHELAHLQGEHDALERWVRVDLRPWVRHVTQEAVRHGAPAVPPLPPIPSASADPSPSVEPSPSPSPSVSIPPSEVCLPPLPVCIPSPSPLLEGDPNGPTDTPG